MKKELNLQSKSLINNNTQSHMKRKLLCLIAAMVLGGTVWAQSYTQHYNPNAHGSETNCPLTAKIQVNSVDSTSTAIELGAFIGTEVRGSAFIRPDLNNTYWIQVFYNPNTETGASISFKAFSHKTNTEYTICYSTLAANGEGYGSAESPVILNFLTPYVFTGNGEWSTATNWQGGVVPANGNAVEINGNCTMDVDAVMASVTVNTGKTLTIPNGKTLTATYALYTTTATQLVIQEGGQLYGNVANAYATIEKNITAYTGTRDNYYFIASPLVSETPYTNIINLTENNYDLYMFDQSQTLEWLYIKDYLDEVPIEPGIGFLYANDNNIILKFSGELNSTVSSTILIKKPGNNIDFKGWNLVGNPFTHNINSNNLYIGSNLGSNQVGTIYQISGDAVVPAENVTIKPAEGFFVVANTNNSTLYFESDGDGDALPVSDLRMEVRSTLRDASLLDRAYVNFNQGTDMPKFAFGDNNVQLYIPQDGKELAVVRSEAQGEIPLNFKANHNGRYTLNIGAENTEMRYLHLIDNMTGKEVDLLDNPNYSFEAKTTDYDSRFKLVFATGQASDDSFAFYSNGNWIINNEGKATLQIIDVAGRMMSNETIEGCHSLNLKAVPGVYMFRLIKGNDVKVQKIIIK